MWFSVSAWCSSTAAVATAITKTRSKNSSSGLADRPCSSGSRGRIGIRRKRVFDVVEFTTQTINTFGAVVACCANLVGPVGWSDSESVHRCHTSNTDSRRIRRSSSRIWACRYAMNAPTPMMNNPSRTKNRPIPFSTTCQTNHPSHITQPLEAPRVQPSQHKEYRGDYQDHGPPFGLRSFFPFEPWTVPRRFGVWLPRRDGRCLSRNRY